MTVGGCVLPVACSLCVLCEHARASVCVVTHTWALTAMQQFPLRSDGCAAVAALQRLLCSGRRCAVTAVQQSPLCSNCYAAVTTLSNCQARVAALQQLLCRVTALQSLLCSSPCCSAVDGIHGITDAPENQNGRKQTHPKTVRSAAIAMQ